MAAVLSGKAVSCKIDVLSLGACKHQRYLRLMTYLIRPVAVNARQATSAPYFNVIVQPAKCSRKRLLFLKREIHSAHSDLEAGKDTFTPRELQQAYSAGTPMMSKRAGSPAVLHSLRRRLHTTRQDAEMTTKDALPPAGTIPRDNDAATRPRFEPRDVPTIDLRSAV